MAKIPLFVERELYVPNIGQMSTALFAGFALAAVLGFLSVVAYLFYLFTIIRFRKLELSSSFYKITFSHGMADLCHYLHNFLTFKIPWWGFYRSFYISNALWLSKTAIVGDLIFSASKCFALVLFTLNRYTAIVYPAGHKQVWTTTTLVCVFSIQWFGSLVAFGPLLISSCWKMEELRNSSSLRPVCVGDSVVESILQYENIVRALSIFVHLPFYCHIFVTIRAKRSGMFDGGQRNANSTVFDDRSVRTKLIITSFIITICCSVRAMYSVVVGIQNANNSESVVFFEFLFDDVVYLCMIWVTLALNSTVRKIMNKFWLGWMNQ